MSRLRIGIVGMGRMGKEITDLMLDKDAVVTAIFRSEASTDKYRNAFANQMRRKARYGLRIAGYIELGVDFERLRGCDLVLETVEESVLAKRRVIKKIEDAVDEDCIIATSSASIDVEEVFSRCVDKSRCVGLCFFPPVRMLEYVEISCPPEVSALSVNTVIGFLEGVGIDYLVTKEIGRLVVTKLITVIVSYAVYIRDEYDVSYSCIDEIIKDSLMMIGAFELIDTYGFKSIQRYLGNFYHFYDDRYTKLYDVLRESMYQLNRAGYGGDNSSGGFLQYELDGNRQFSAVGDDDAKLIAERICAMFLNDVAFYCNKGQVDISELNRILKVVLGLVKSPAILFEELGRDKIKLLLKHDYERMHIQLFEFESYECFYGG